MIDRSAKVEAWAHKERVTHKGQPDTDSAGNEIVHVEDVQAERRQILNRRLGSDCEAAPSDKQPIGEARRPCLGPSEDRKREAEPHHEVGRRVEHHPKQRGMLKRGPKNLLRKREEKGRRERQCNWNPIPIR